MLHYRASVGVDVIALGVGKNLAVDNRGVTAHIAVTPVAASIIAAITNFFIICIYLNLDICVVLFSVFQPYHGH